MLVQTECPAWCSDPGGPQVSSHGRAPRGSPTTTTTTTNNNNNTTTTTTTTTNNNDNNNSNNINDNNNNTTTNKRKKNTRLAGMRGSDPRLAAYLGLQPISVRRLWIPEGLTQA